MEELRRTCKTVSVAELINRVRKGETGLAAVTFDDGYRDCYEHAFPVLQEFAIPFSIFVTSGFIERGKWDFQSKIRLCGR